MNAYYYTLTMFFFGYFVALAPSTKKGDNILILPTLIIICLIAAILFPLTLSAIAGIIFIGRRKVK